MMRYKALVWPARPGRWDSQPTVGECEAENIEEAIRVLGEDPQVIAALVEEDGRLADGFGVGDEDINADPQPGRAYVDVHGPGDHDDYPMLAIFADT